MTTASTWRDCEQCGARNESAARACWLCHRTLGDANAVTDATTSASVHRPAQFTFGISSMMLLIALVAICLGIGVEAPAIGIGLAIISTPALIRTAVATSRLGAKGVAPSMGGKVVAFLGSLGVVVTTGVAASVAFYATCWAGFLGGAAVSSIWAKEYEPIAWGLGAGVLVGIVAGGWVLVWLVRKLWPVKD